MLPGSRWWCTLLVAASLLAQPVKQADSLDRWTRDYVEDWHQRHPGMASLDGSHRHDTRLASFSPGALADEASALAGFQERLGALATPPLSKEGRLKLRLAQDNLALRRLDLESLRPWTRDPQVYAEEITNGLMWLTLYPSRPAPQRLKALIAREREIPRLLAEARANLQAPPEVFVRVGRESLSGLADFIRTDIPRALHQVKDPTLQRDLKESTRLAAGAIDGFLRWMEVDLMPRARGTFALGSEAFSNKLRWKEGVTTPLPALLAEGERALARAEARFASLCGGRPAAEAWAAVQADRPPADHLLAEARGQLAELQAFVRTKELVSLPGRINLRVTPTPAFLVGTFAGLYGPGPFETRAVPFDYFVTLPGPDLTPSQQEDLLKEFNRPTLWNTSVHEAYPGHYVQGLHLALQRDPLRSSVLFSADSLVEGWAHYCEQLMVEQGFHGDDPRMELAQVRDAVLRLCRYLVAIRLHTQGASLEEATRFFRVHAQMEEGPARTEAERGAYDPMYLTYTLGKQQILALREDIRRKEGAAFNLQRFHDRLLAQGQVPLWFSRAILLDEEVP